MNPQPPGEGGLAAGGGPGDQHNALAPVHNLPGNVPDGLVVQGLVDADELPKLLPLGQLRQVGGVQHAQDLAPGRRLAEGRHVLGAIHIGGGHVGGIRRGQKHHEARRVGMQRKGLHIPRGGGHGAVEILPHIAAAVHVEEPVRPPAEQVHLVLLPLPGKVVDGLLQPPPPADEGHIRRHNGAHLRLHIPHHALGHGQARQPHQHPVAHGVFDAHLLAGIKAAQGQQ